MKANQATIEAMCTKEGQVPKEQSMYAKDDAMEPGQREPTMVEIMDLLRKAGVPKDKFIDM